MKSGLYCVRWRADGSYTTADLFGSRAAAERHARLVRRVSGARWRESHPVVALVFPDHSIEGMSNSQLQDLVDHPNDAAGLRIARAELARRVPPEYRKRSR